MSRASLALLALSLMVACGDDGSGTDAGRLPDSGRIDSDGGTDAAVVTVPTVLSNAPLSGATDVPINGNASVVFSEAMDPSSLDGATFTLSSGEPAVAIPGTVIYSGTTAVFWPAAILDSDTMITATVTTGALSALGVPLEADHVWRFTTGDTRTPGLPVNLGTAGDFVILAKSGISTVPTSAITGDIAVSPAAASFITGFALTADATNVFSMSPQVTGRGVRRRLRTSDAGQPDDGRERHGARVHRRREPRTRRD